MTRLQRYPSQPTKNHLIQLPMTKKEAEILSQLLHDHSVSNAFLAQLYERLKTKIAKHGEQS